MSAAGRRPWRRRLVLGAPLVWLLAFFAAPLLVVLRLSFSETATALPPYAPTFDLAGGLQGLVDSARRFTTASYALLADDPIYLDSLLSSLRLAGLASVAALLVAYPLALAMARAPRRWRPFLVLMAVAPFWTSFLIRVYAWITILKDEGLLNHLLLATGLVAQPLRLFASEGAVVIGIVYSYLPFMVLPIYNALERQDGALVEAARDLGATPAAAFWRVTFPLSLPGVLAGLLLTFIPAVGEFVIPDLLGGSDTLMIGRTIWNDFFANRDWPAASASAVVLLLALLAPLVLFERRQMREEVGP